MILGQAWLVLKPLLDGAAYAIVFGLVLKSSRGIENFLGYLIIGIFMFSFTARCLSQGATSVANGKSLVRGFSFPRASLPISAVLRETLGMAPVVATMLVLITAVPPHAEITWRWILFPIVIVLQVAFNLGIGLIAARIVHGVRDLTNLISVGTRFWLYGSAVFFSYDAFIQHPTALAIVKINPLFLVLDISRDLLLYGQTPDLRSWLILLTWSSIALAIGFTYFWRGEEGYGRD